jgi:N-acyl amino acid synthase of PEP-CTERM/exosortase system
MQRAQGMPMRGRYPAHACRRTIVASDRVDETGIASVRRLRALRRTRARARLVRLVPRRVRALASSGSAKVISSAYARCFDVVHADTDALREAVFRLRYQVFCVENAFEDPRQHPDGLERDAYDPRSHHCLLRHRSSGEHAGAIRVVLPDPDAPRASFPLQAVCEHPFLREEAHAARLCEISRLCIRASFRRRRLDGSIYPGFEADAARRRAGASSDFLTGRIIPYMPMGLFRGAFETVLKLGRVDCIAVMEPRLIRTIRATGFCSGNLGPVIDFHGLRQPVVFNLRQVYDHGRQSGSLFYPLMSDHGRLYRLAIQNERAHGSVMPDFHEAHGAVASA